MTLAFWVAAIIYTVCCCRIWPSCLFPTLSDLFHDFEYWIEYFQAKIVDCRDELYNNIEIWYPVSTKLFQNMIFSTLLCYDHKYAWAPSASSRRAWFVGRIVICQSSMTIFLASVEFILCSLSVYFATKQRCQRASAMRRTSCRSSGTSMIYSRFVESYCERLAQFTHFMKDIQQTLMFHLPAPHFESQYAFSLSSSMYRPEICCVTFPIMKVLGYCIDYSDSRSVETEAVGVKVSLC